MNIARAILIRRERQRQRREGSSTKERLSVSPLLRNTLAADKQLHRAWRAAGEPLWKSLLRAFIIQR
ncbi:hypothetical protein CFR80_17470 [Komagataeibacter oboediens]|uniref:Uncharacterized protein n=1 Tax=Komagataeibacter oboediens TaxID=65958 RepID=A0A318QIH4_9PROT|nr:hypothetical protein CFR80_17470 [Komagataeibacter oboediens]